MEKIPVEATLVGAYRFVFTNIVSIIGTLWLPFVVMAALIAGLLYVVLPHAFWTANIPDYDTPKALLSALLPVIYIYPLVALIALIAVSMMFVGLMRHALGHKQTTTFVYFSLDAPVWRMTAARLLTDIVLLLLGIVLILLFCLAYKFALPGMPRLPAHTTLLFWLNFPVWLALTCHIAHNCQSVVPHVQAITGLVILGFVEICVMIYAALRLYFFLPSVVVAENRIGLGRSWSLGGGNFWRIFVVTLLVVVPISIITGLVYRMTVAPVVHAGMHSPHPRPLFGALTAYLRVYLPLLPIVLAIKVVDRIVFFGLLMGASGTAYNIATAMDTPAAASAEKPGA